MAESPITGLPFEMIPSPFPPDLFYVLLQPLRMPAQHFQDILPVASVGETQGGDPFFPAQCVEKIQKNHILFRGGL